MQAGRGKTVEVILGGDRPQILLKQRFGLGHIEVISFDGLTDLEECIRALQEVRDRLNRGSEGEALVLPLCEF